MLVKANRARLLISDSTLRGEFVAQPLDLKNTRDYWREAERVKKALEAALRAGLLEAEFTSGFPIETPRASGIATGRADLG